MYIYIIFFFFLSFFIFYFFVGIWGIGIATRNTNLNKVPLGGDNHSWVLCSDNSIRHRAEEKHRISEAIQEGDVLVIFKNLKLFNLIFTYITL